VDYDTTDVAYGGDFPSQVIDIKGSTVNKITVPYLWQTAYRPTYAPGEDPAVTVSNLTPRLQVDLLTLPVTSQGTEPQITLVIFRAGAEDMQFSVPCSSQIDPVYMNGTKVIPQGQTSLQDEFKFTFPAITCKCSLATEQGFCTTETTGKLTDLCKRFVTAASLPGTLHQEIAKPGVAIVGSTVSFSVGPGITVDDQLVLSPYYQILQHFKYERGSIRYRYLMAPDATDKSNVYFTPGIGAATEGSGIVVWARSMNPVFTVESPWTATVPYYPVELQSILRTTTMVMMNFFSSPLTEEDNIAYVSFGDDRIHSYLLPPARYVYTPEPPLILKEEKTRNSSRQETVSGLSKERKNLDIKQPPSKPKRKVKDESS